MKNVKFVKRALSMLLCFSMLLSVFTIAVSAGTDYFSGVSGAVNISVFGGSICGSAGDQNWNNLVATYIGQNYTGGKSINLTKYAVGGVGSTVGLSRMTQLVNPTGGAAQLNSNVVVIEYSVNDASCYTMNIDKTAPVTQSTEVKFEDGKLNIYNPDTNTYSFDYVNAAYPNHATRPTGRYTVTVDQAKLSQSLLRVEEMVRLAQSLDSNPAVILVNVGLGLTLGDAHPEYPNFPGFYNSIATEYTKMAQRLGVASIDVEKLTWQYIEDRIAAGISAGTYTDRATAKAAIQLEMYGDQSNIHPTVAGCQVYADFINAAIDANPASFLTYSQASNYTATTSYSENTHVKPYTSANISGDGWSVANTSDTVFPYALSTSKVGDSVSFDFSGTQLALLISGSGNYSYKVENLTDGGTMYESSIYATGYYFWDQNTSLGGQYLQNGKNYRVTITKSSGNADAIQVKGIMANEAIPVGGYTTWDVFNQSYIIPIEEQYFNFTNKPTASDPTIQTYFADETNITIGSGVNYERVDDREALKVTTTADNQSLLNIKLNNAPPAGSLIAFEFDVKFNSAQVTQSEFFLADPNAAESAYKIFRILNGNAASPCINSGSNRFSTTASDWWALNANDDKYHNIKVLINDVSGVKTIYLYIDGVKGDTTYTTSALTFNNFNFKITKSGTSAYLDDIHVYDEVQNIMDSISSLGTVSIDDEAEINKISDRADNINSLLGSYDRITNYTTLTAAKARIQELKDLLAQFIPQPSVVMSNINSGAKVFDINGDYTVTDVLLNGTALVKDTNYFIKGDRLKLAENLTTTVGQYTLKVVYDVDGNSMDGSYTFNTSTAAPIIIDPASSFETYPTGSYGSVGSATGYWGGVNTSWVSWSDTGKNPYYLRMDLTKTSPNYFSDGSSALTKYFKIKNLPQGTYKIEYPKYGTLTANRIPAVNVELKGSTTSTVSNIDPFSSTKGYYTLSEAFKFTGQNTDYVKISPVAPQPSGKTDSGAILCVFGLRLTPVAPYSADAVEFYYNYGTVDAVTLINEVTNAAELQEAVENVAGVIGVNANYLLDMSSVYAELIKGIPYSDTAAFVTAFNNETSKYLQQQTVARTRSLEDLQLVNSNFYVRDVASFAIYSSTGVARPVYLTYKLDNISIMKDIDISFSNSKATSFYVDFSLGQIPAPVVTDSNGTVTDAASIQALHNYVDSFVSSFTNTVTLPANQTVSLDLNNIVSLAKGNGSEYITLKFYPTAASTFNSGIENIVLTEVVDSTGIEPPLTYSVDKVSYVNYTTGANADKGYIGSAFISKKFINAEDSILILASYKDNELVNIKRIDLDASQITSSGVEIPIEMYTDIYPDYVKAFVWDSMLNLKPVSAALTINAPTNTDLTWYMP